MPIIELYLLFRLHELVGWRDTIAVVILTGLIGAALARVQGMQVLRSIQSDLAEGRMPAPHILDGVMILVAGAFLVTPGLITDAVGFLLLVPPVRAAIRIWLRSRLEAAIARGSTNVRIWGNWR